MKIILEFLVKNPLILEILIVVAIVAIILFITLVIKVVLGGGEFSTKWFTLQSKKKQTEAGTSPQTITQANSVSNAPVFNNVFSPSTVTLSQEQLLLVANRVAEVVREIRLETKDSPPNYLYQPSELPDRLAYVYRVNHDIARSIMGIVLNYGGGWAGASMASFDSYYDKATRFKLLPQSLESNINDFFFYTQPYLNHGEGIPDSAFLDIQYLAAHIADGLSFVLRNTGPSKRGYPSDELTKG